MCRPIIAIILLLFTNTPTKIQKMHTMFMYLCKWITVFIYFDLCSMKELMSLNFVLQPCVSWQLNYLVPCNIIINNHKKLLGINILQPDNKHVYFVYLLLTLI